jgi:Flp pilus assembly protein TadD/cell division protein FtsN
MTCTATTKRALGLALTTALAGTMLTGCATSAAPPASVSASKATRALEDGKAGKAIAHAEAAVLADPRNPAYRATLASAYLDAGRFASAATSFDDAMLLGDDSPRTALSLALSLMGQGKLAEAAALLNEWDGRIPVADQGLALALAGQPDRGIHLMSHAIRSGDNNAKMRQNLAYAYALAGRWREARLMAAQDLQGAQLDSRIEEWSRLTLPEAWHHRIAALLQVPAATPDTGQPIELALSNTPSLDQLGEEAQALAVAERAPLAAPAPAERPFAGELPALQPLERAEAVPARPVAAPMPSFAQAPVAQAPAPRPQAQRAPAEQPALERVAQRTRAAEGTHLVQLGSFASEQGARNAWKHYTKKYPQLSGHDMVITEALVRGKTYWRVSAAGFGRDTASSMCGKVRSSGAGCLAYAAGKPLPGAVDSGIRMARR